MPILTVTAKGQVTLRKDVLNHLGLRPGDKVAIDNLPGGRVEMRAAKPTGKISDVFGMLRAPEGTRLTIEEMNEVIEKGWAGEL